VRPDTRLHPTNAPNPHKSLATREPSTQDIRSGSELPLLNTPLEAGKRLPCDFPGRNHHYRAAWRARLRSDAAARHLGAARLDLPSLYSGCTHTKRTCGTPVVVARRY
jgi:hypothetical protein